MSLASFAHAEHMKLDKTVVMDEYRRVSTSPTIAEKKADFSHIPGGAGVVDVETYKSGRSSTLQDALGMATGVFIQPRFGAGEARLAGLPRQFIKGEKLWQREGWYAGPTFEWGPTHYNVDQAETLYADGYAIWGLKGGYRPGEGFGFFVEGRSLSDKTYVATTGVIADAQGRGCAPFLPGDGRAGYAGLEWRMKRQDGEAQKSLTATGIATTFCASTIPTCPRG